MLKYSVSFNPTALATMSWHRLVAVSLAALKSFVCVFFKLIFVGTFLRNKFDQSYQILILWNYELQYPNGMSSVFRTTLIFAFGQSNELIWNAAATNTLNFGVPVRWYFDGWDQQNSKGRVNMEREQIFHCAKFMIQVKTVTKKGRKSNNQLTASWCCYKKSQTVKIYVSIIGFAESEATKVLQGWSLAAALNTRWEQWGGISTGITKMLRI